MFTLALCHYLYQGRTWARWFTVAVSLAASVGGVVVALPALPAAPVAIVFLFVAALYGLCALVLVFSRPARAFLRHQHEVRS